MKSILIRLLVRLRRGAIRVADRVAGAWDRLDQRIREALVHLFAQPVDMHVDDVAARLEIIVPGGLQQHRARDDLAGVADQLFQQEEFATLKVDQPSRSRHSPADRVELKVAYPQDRAATGAVGPAAKRPEAR